MRIRVEKEILLPGIQRVQGIIDKRSSMPILANLLMEGNNSELRITATDLEIGIKGTCPATVYGRGMIAVSGKKLFEVVKELPDGYVDISVEDGKYITIRSGKSFFKMAAMHGEDYPSLPEAGEDDMISIESGVYGDMIKKTIFSVAEADPRHVLNGALLEIEAIDANETKIRMVGTNGHKLAVCERSLKLPEGKNPVAEGETVRQLIIPRKTLLELRRFLDVNEQIKIGIGDKQISFKGESVFITSRLIEGNYPKYKQVIPQGDGYTVRANRSIFMNVIKRVAVMSKDKTRVVLFRFSEGKVILQASDPEIGEAREEVDIEYKGPEINIGLNSQYLLDALEVINDDDAVLELQTNLSPCIIRQDSDPDFLCLVMPMRVQEEE